MNLQEELNILNSMRRSDAISEEEYLLKVENINRELEEERAKLTTYFFRDQIG